MPLALGIAGHSGSGKTTLIERLLPKLRERGWRIGVLKHDAHRLDLDRPGKDTARFFDAGASMVCGHDPTQSFVRRRTDGPLPIADVLADVPEDLDLVLVEGHKAAPISKLVLEHPDERPPITGPEVLATLPWGEERLAQALGLVVAWVERRWAERALSVAILVGGRSRRMGARKAMLELEGRTLVEQVVERLRPWGRPMVLVGGGRLPATLRDELCVVPDAPDVLGPLAGLLGLMRHDRSRAWLVVGCDQPRFTPEHASWLDAQRRPGAWLVLPRQSNAARAEPVGAIYEPMLLPELERAAARGDRALYVAVARAPQASVTPTGELASGWESVNTPEQWLALTGTDPRELVD
jgi:molybdopterin-guanine dinucleotide biosynthesis protein MobB